MYTIQKLGLKVNMPVSTIRYYERVGILKPKRKENGYRYFDNEDIKKIKYIRVMKYAGFSIDEIKILIFFLDRPVAKNCTEKSNELLTLREFQIEKRIEQDKLVLELLHKLKPKVIVDEYEQVESEVDEKIDEIFLSITEEKE